MRFRGNWLSCVDECPETESPTVVQSLHESDAPMPSFELMSCRRSCDLTVGRLTSEIAVQTEVR